MIAIPEVYRCQQSIRQTVANPTRKKCTFERKISKSNPIGRRLKSWMEERKHTIENEMNWPAVSTGLMTVQVRFPRGS